MWVLPALLLGCTPQGAPAIGSEGFRDDFERSTLGAMWRNTGGPYELKDGWLHVRGARNKPLWLRRKLPRDARVEFDVRSESDDGDIKVEVFGDGSSKAEQESYDATSYVIIFGGWSNSKNVIARMNEHGDDRVEGPARRVEPGKVYHMKIERRGNTVRAWVDGQELATMVDDDPLEGPGHEYFAFNNWESDLWFDNFRVTPL
jgi:hypothetical protein